MTPLEQEIHRLIAIDGPIPVARYMALCLGHPVHGYYRHRDPFGAGGDFVTAPEISQMFGELIGLWAAAVWQQMGTPSPVRLVELGPGRGTLMADALRAAKVLPAFRAALQVDLVETSPHLRQHQQTALEGAGVPLAWHDAIEDVPDGPAIVIANEFVDALPVQQLVRQPRGWHERMVGIDADGRLAFALSPDPLPHIERILPPGLRDAPLGAVFEWRADHLATELGRRAAAGSVALIVDYGHARSAPGETLQALRAHAYADPLDSPGDADLTAHVDFEALGRAAAVAGARIFGPIEQATFLRRLGIAERAAALKQRATEPQRRQIDAALARLTDTVSATAMGRLFKVMAIAPPELAALPAFDNDG